MKRILAVCASLLSISAMATTLNPIQLLNPAGSTSGQVISSTGPVTAPAWSAISALGYAPLFSPAFTGTPTAPTPATTDASTKVATTSMVNSAFSSPPVSIGGGVPTSGAFTSLSAPSGLNNTPIGLASPQPATVTNLTASGTVSGAGFTTLLSPYLTTASATSTYTPLASPTGSGTLTWPVLKASGFARLNYVNTSAQSIAASTLTTVTTWTSVTDDNSNFTASTGTFTAPNTGWYLISGQVQFNVASGVINNQFQVLIVANAVTVGTFTTILGGAVTGVAIPFSVAVKMTAAQTALVRVFQTSSGAQTLNNGAAANVISIVELP